MFRNDDKNTENHDHQLPEEGLEKRKPRNFFGSFFEGRHFQHLN